MNADNLMGLPVQHGPGSCNSAVLKVRAMLVMLRLKSMSNGSLLTVQGHMKKLKTYSNLLLLTLLLLSVLFELKKRGGFNCELKRLLRDCLFG